MFSKRKKIEEAYKKIATKERSEKDHLEGIEKKMHDFIIYFLEELWVIRTLLILIILLIGIPQLVFIILLFINSYI